MMSPELLAAIKASIANPAHAWRATGVAGHEHTRIKPILGPPTESGVPTYTFTEIEIIETTYQFRSIPLDATIVFMAHEEPGHADIALMWRGVRLVTDDAELIATIKTMSAGAVENADGAARALFEREAT